ncbi:RNA polymerase sigma factor [Flaviaesturariibacter amylovorans]|uniref:RNA polymerase sigma factor n=1 Tax=Flaviaesturariibacter amylovorans TaxID=1084520 RepID=A0ABP8HQG3_9BACT
MTTTPSDTDLLRGCRKGDRKAQELLYRNYYRSMMALCLRYCGNDEDAMEALNNGFLKVFRNVARYDAAQGSLYTWMRTIVLNACLDYIKSRSRNEPTRELTDTMEADLPAEAVSRLQAAELLALVRALPPATAAVFNLYAIEGYNHREIGTLLGISEGTSKWHLSTARKQLQQMIHQQNLKCHE